MEWQITIFLVVSTVLLSATAALLYVAYTLHRVSHRLLRLAHAFCAGADAVADDLETMGMTAKFISGRKPEAKTLYAAPDGKPWRC